LSTLYARFAAHLDDALDALEREGALAPGLDRKAVSVEPPRDASHGDLATNAAMVLAKKAGTNPRALAALIAPKVSALPEVESVEIAGPGFLNIRLDPSVWREELRAILAGGGDYGRSALGQGSRVNVEYVSANPTGPMHMGHCRGAVVGDALASLLQFAGYAVIREYYVNDAGAQVDVLARSAYLRYLEALGRQIGEIPEGLYPGDYLKPVGGAFAAEYGELYADAPESEWLGIFRRRTVAAMLIGGAIKGGRVLADWPGLAPSALYEQRDLKPTLDLDALVANALAQHYSLDLVRTGAALFPESAAPKPVPGLIRA
jgi:arginyl-tRNA synthetase